MVNQIPENIIGTVAGVLEGDYTHTGLDILFSERGNISVADFKDSKPKKIMHGLDIINKKAQETAGAKDPLAVLGKLLEAYMDVELLPEDHIFLDLSANVRMNKQRHENRERIQTALKEAGFIYQRGGLIASLAQTAQPAQTLTEQIAAQGLSAVQQEIERAMRDLDNDLPSALHRAGNLTEAVYKAYLIKNNISYTNAAKASDLWREVKANLQLNPVSQPNEQLRNIASSLNKVVQAVMELRNQEGASHGKDNEQYIQSQALTRAQAQLAVNAAATLSYYILEV